MAASGERALSEPPETQLPCAHPQLRAVEDKISTNTHSTAAAAAAKVAEAKPMTAASSSALSLRLINKQQS